MGSCERAPWFGCSCCPVNDVRFIPEIASYVYATRGNELFVNLFMGGSAQVKLAGTAVEVKQTTQYPWSGKVLITLEPKRATKFTVNVRIPGWVWGKPVPSDLYRYADAEATARARGTGGDSQFLLGATVVGLAIKVNGQDLSGAPMLKGFLAINRTWKPGDTIELDLPMPVRRVLAHPNVQADRDRFAIERGPLVYCAEGADNGGHVLDRVFPGKIHFEVQPHPELLGGITTIRMTADEGGSELTCIPYYAWCHRGPNEMRVWFPVQR